MVGVTYLMKGDKMKTKKYSTLRVMLAVICGSTLYTINGCADKEEVGEYNASTRIEAQYVGTGIDAMYVVVEDLTKDAIEAGLTRKQIQTDVELKLRQEGIRIRSTPVDAFLCVNVNILKILDGSMLANSITVELKQVVFLMRNPKILILATTWSKSMTGYAGETVFVSSMRQDVSDLVDIFLNDYLAANPKEPASKKLNRLEGLLKGKKPKDE